jgi:hypothetical protein
MLDSAAVERLVALALPGATPAEFAPVGRRSLRLTVTGRDIAYHLAARDTRDEAIIERDVMALARQRVPVPSVLWAGDAPGIPPCVLRTWVEGAPLSEAAVGPGVWGVIGGVAARIGHMTFPAGGFLGPGLQVVEPTGSLSKAVREALEHCLLSPEVAGRLGDRLRIDTATFVMRTSHRLDLLTERRNLVHGDLRPANIILGPGGQPAAIVGWERAFSGPPLFDLGTMLRCAPPEAADAFADGFLPANSNHREARMLAGLLSLTDLLGSLRRSDDPAAVEAVRRIIGSIAPEAAR